MQDQLVITGKFIAAMATETVGKNGFTVRKFYVDITTNPEWPNTPEFQLKGDKVNLVDNLQKGQTVQVKFNIDGRKFLNPTTGKTGIITSLNAWKIDVVQMQSAAVATPVAARQAPAPVPVMAGPGNYSQPAELPAAQVAEKDDLPF